MLEGDRTSTAKSGGAVYAAASDLLPVRENRDIRDEIIVLVKKNIRLKKYLAPLSFEEIRENIVDIPRD